MFPAHDVPGDGDETATSSTSLLSSILQAIGALLFLPKLASDGHDDRTIVAISACKPTNLASRYGLPLNVAYALTNSCRSAVSKRSLLPSLPASCVLAAADDVGSKQWQCSDLLDERDRYGCLRIVAVERSACLLHVQQCLGMPTTQRSDGDCISNRALLVDVDAAAACASAAESFHLNKRQRSAEFDGACDGVRAFWPVLLGMALHSLRRRMGGPCFVAELALRMTGGGGGACSGECVGVRVRQRLVQRIVERVFGMRLREMMVDGMRVVIGHMMIMQPNCPFVTVLQVRALLVTR
jgi:hypothetical protein